MKKQRIHRESAKLRRTSHWDLDYLPLKEVEALYRRAGKNQAHKIDGRKSNTAGNTGMSSKLLGVLFMLVGAALVGLAVVIGQHLTGS